VAYCLFAGRRGQLFSARPFKKALWLVLCSYGAGLLCCMIAFAFFIISNTLMPLYEKEQALCFQAAA